MNGCIIVRMKNGWIDIWMCWLMDEWKNVWLDERVNGWMDELMRIDEGMNWYIKIWIKRVSFN